VADGTNLSMQLDYLEDATPRGPAGCASDAAKNHTADTFDDACQIVRGYCQRWHIEAFHKTWKSGACNVEESQLRSAAQAWAVQCAPASMRSRGP
jgi:hypothetical protein